jgi:hypothetical protein
MTTPAKQASGQLAAAIAEAGRVIAGLASGAAKLNRLPTVTVWGVLGGGVCTLGGYIVTLSFAASFPVVGPLAATIGIAGGVLIARRVLRNPMEEAEEERRIAIERNREVLQLLRDELNKPGNPKALKDDLVKKISLLNEELVQLGRIEHKPTVLTGSDGIKLLPAPAGNRQ